MDNAMLGLFALLIILGLLPLGFFIVCLIEILEDL